MNPQHFVYLCTSKTKIRLEMKKVLWMIACLCIGLSAAAQQQGVVRTLERPGKPSVGIEGVSVEVLEYPNVIVSKKGGKFSFAIPGKRQGDSYTVTRVQKKGYTLVDKQLKGRRFAYSSSVPVEIVMVADAQLENDKKRIEDKAYDKAKKDYDRKVSALEKQLQEKTISEREYRVKCEELSNNYNNYVQLIDQMAERYATTDYKGLDEVSRKTQEAIENADLKQADILINSKGDFNKREQELRDKLELKKKSEQLSQQLEEDINIELNSLKEDFASKAYICAADYRFDSVAYYLDRIIRLDTTDVYIISFTARFVDQYLADYPRALYYFQLALSQAQKQNGEVSESAGRMSEWIGLIYDHMGDYDKSLEWHKKAIDIYDQTEGLENPDVATVYTHIGRIYMNKKDYEKALEYTLRGLEIRDRTVSDKNDLYFGQSYNNLGVIYHGLGENDKALEYHKKALKIREQSMETNPDHAAISYFNIGGLYYDIDEYDSALVYLQKALNVYQTIYGLNHPMTYSVLNWIGATYGELGNNEKALESYQQALNSSDNYYGTQSNESARSCQLVADSYYNMGNMDKAIEYLQRAIDIYCSIGASDTPEVQQLKEVIQKLKETKP